MKDRQVPERESLAEPESSASDTWIVVMFDELRAEEEARRAQLLLHRPADWQALYETNTRVAWHYPPESPARRAAGWWETERVWNDLHPEIIPSMVCAGCRQTLGIGPVITLNMGYAETRGQYRIHDNGRSSCLNTFHAHRRLTARRALIALGLVPPG